MKKIALYFTGFAFSALMFSCSTSNVTRFSGSDLEVVSSQPTMKQAAPTEDVAMAEVKPAETVAVEAAPAVAPVVAAPVSKNVNAVVKFNESAQKLSKELEALTASTNDAMVKKTLTRTSTALSKLNVNAEKLSLMDKIKMRLFGKMFDRYAEKVSGAMDTSDILAICALVSGILAMVSYYGSFLFGVAGIVLGVIALKKGTSRRGMALAGIILGAIGLLFWIIWIAVIAAILI
jgi:hypothetical protein